MIPGFDCRITEGKSGGRGIAVRRIYFYADSTKRPGTPAGDKWIQEESSVYAQGQEDPRWQKEMLIKYSAMGGQFLFPRWDHWKSTTPIILDPYDPVGTALYGSYDHGHANPAAFHIHSVDGDGVITTVWEFYGKKVTAHQIANIIQGKDGYDEDGKRYAGNPWGYSALKWIIADPSIWKEDIPDHNGPNKSTAQIFRELGIYMIPGERGGDVTLANWLKGYYWKDLQNPRYRITRNCEKLLWEIGQQRFKEFSAQVALNRSQPEELVDKDNHGWDGVKYLLKKFPPPEHIVRPESRPNSFAWWRKVANTQRDGGAVMPTFRIGVR